MKGVPPEIDALLWRLAEDGSATARAEFELRHARYGPELTRRIQMVAELRQAGRTMARRPAFTPRPTRTMPPPRWAVGSALGLGVLAIGAVAYVIASPSERASPTPSVKPQTVVGPPKTVLPSPPIDSTAIEPKETPPQTEVATEEPKPNQTPKYRMPRDTHISDTALTSAIQLVAAGGGLDVTVAPGFEDRKVSFDYTGLDTVDTLKAMGNEYGFTVLEEQEGHFLVVPAREQPSLRRNGP